jgi:hypothetical protein
MHTSNSKLEHANVVAVFDSQDDADEALMGLRIAGFPDRQIGYFSRSMSGLVVDAVGRTYLVIGMVLGLATGALLGLWAGRLVEAGQATPLAPPLVPDASAPLALLAIILGSAFVLGVIGASFGYCFHRRDAAHVGTEMEAGRFVMTVEAGDRKDEVWAILRSHGGRHPGPVDHVELPPSLKPTPSA